MKLAIVHDFLNQYGGAERVVEALHDVFPEAPIFTSIFLPDRLPAAFRRMDVRTSFMQRLPGLRTHYKKYLPLYPFAIESFDLAGFDVVLSSSSAFAKGARVPAGARHICYCYTPMRFAWNPKAYLEREPVPLVLRPFLPPTLAWLRGWDVRTSRRVDDFVAISGHIRDRIRASYGREAEIIFPPVKTKAYRTSEPVEDYYLVVSRLNAYKNIELVVDAFNESGRPLVVIGHGPQERTLRDRARGNVRLMGGVDQETLARALGRCRALIFPGEEDFGIAPVEAMASGRPVVAYGRGGALETVKEGETGVFFREPSPASLNDAVRRLEGMKTDPARIRRHAETFDEAVFKDKIRRFVLEKRAAR